MARSAYRETIQTSAEVERVSIACDTCGREIFAGRFPYACELLIGLDPDECVSAKIRRDYCSTCIIPKWDAICAIVGADPDTHDNEWSEDFN